MPTVDSTRLRSPALAGGGSSLHTAQTRALRMIEEGAALRDILAHLASTIETLSESGSVVSILLLDREGLLRNGASPNLPANYLDAIDRLKPDANVGTCAAAAATGEVVVTPDFLADPRWDGLRHLPLVLGFQGAWSMPIKAPDGQVLGTFGTYFRDNRLPTAQEMADVRELAGVAALAIRAQGSRAKPPG